MDIQFTAPRDGSAPLESDPALPVQTLDDAWVGNRPLWQQRQQLIHHLDVTGSAADTLTIVSDAWISADDARTLLSGGADHITDSSSGEPIAWTGDSLTAPSTGNGSFRIRTTSDLLAIHRQLMNADAVNYHAGSVAPDVAIDGFLMIDKGSSVGPGASVTGTVAIGKGSTIGAGVAMNGLVAISNNATIGDNTALTDCIVYPDTTVPAGATFDQQVLVPQR